MEFTAGLKRLACEEIEKQEELLNGVSQKIWANPELGFEENDAHDLLTDILTREGFDVKRRFPLNTAFVASFGSSGGPRIGIMCEYDALPGIGHACGHNLIAEAGLGAAMGLKSVLKKTRDYPGKVIVYGTPAEEGGGGKCLMLDERVFDGIDVCLMVHPADVDALDGSKIFIAREQVQITYTGKASHASAQPWGGINALDAAVACYSSVSMMRQQIKPTCRIHGVITDGGLRPNIIPAKSQLLYYLRAPSRGELDTLKEKFLACAEGAAKATGCTYEAEVTSKTYFNILGNERLTDLYRKNVTSLGLDEGEPPKSILASTDAGNVSYHKPTIHPLFAIPADGSLHTKKFQKAAGSPEAQVPTIRAAKAMAMTAIDLLCDSALLPAITEEFKMAKQKAESS